jgi:hypothetical protein
LTEGPRRPTKRKAGARHMDADDDDDDKERTR